MSIGFIIIMIVVVALVIGPVMMLRPDPRQKNKENMRLLARQKGIHFSMRKLPQQAADNESPEPVAAYCLPPINPASMDDWLLLRTSYQHDIHFLGWWVWAHDRQATLVEQEVLKAYLPDFPESIKAISSGSKGTCVYWTEKANDNLLNNIFTLLEKLQGILPGR